MINVMHRKVVFYGSFIFIYFGFSISARINTHTSMPTHTSLSIMLVGILPEEDRIEFHFVVHHYKAVTTRWHCNYVFHNPFAFLILDMVWHLVTKEQLCFLDTFDNFHQQRFYIFRNVFSHITQELERLQSFRTVGLYCFPLNLVNAKCQHHAEGHCPRQCV